WKARPNDERPIHRSGSRVRLAKRLARLVAGERPRGDRLGSPIPSFAPTWRPRAIFAVERRAAAAASSRATAIAAQCVQRGYGFNGREGSRRFQIWNFK